MSLNQKVLDYILNQTGDFNQLALETFAHQYQQCKPYQEYCRKLNQTPENIDAWQEIPPVSTEVFREFDLCTLPPETARYVFQTSGTSQEKKGKHYYHDMTLYDASIQASFMQGMGLSSKDRATFRILTPSFSEVPTSSLFYMFQKVLEWYGNTSSQFYSQDYAGLTKHLLNDTQKSHPVILLGTAFSFVNFFDYLNDKNIALKLPKESKLLETGGLKGRTRHVSREALYQLFNTQLGLESEHCFSEYGMTELSSQCYGKPNSHVFFSPPWMPVRIIHPEKDHEVAIGETGLVQFFDLANTTALSAILTSDLAIKHPQGFELVGRSPHAILRGCSTVFE